MVKGQYLTDELLSLFYLKIGFENVLKYLRRQFFGEDVKNWDISGWIGSKRLQMAWLNKGRIKFEQVDLSHYFPHHKLGQIMLYES